MRTAHNMRHLSTLLICQLGLCCSAICRGMHTQPKKHACWPDPAERMMAPGRHAVSSGTSNIFNSILFNSSSHVFGRVQHKSPTTNKGTNSSGIHVPTGSLDMKPRALLVSARGSCVLLGADNTRHSHFPASSARHSTVRAGTPALSRCSCSCRPTAYIGCSPCGQCSLRSS